MEPYRAAHDGYISNYLQLGDPKIIGIGREVKGKRKNGTTFPVHLAVSEIVVKHRRLFTGVVRDISDLREAQSHAEGIGRLIDDSLNEIFIFDARSWKFITVNRGARENLGYSMDELSQIDAGRPQTGALPRQFRGTDSAAVGREKRRFLSSKPSTVARMVRCMTLKSICN